MKSILLAALLIALPAQAGYTGAPWEPLKDETKLKQLFVDHSDLRDPFSLQFRAVQVRAAGLDEGKTLTTWCGEVNAKNAMGAYTGWDKFYATEGLGDKPNIGIVAGDAANSRDIMLKLMCKGSSLVGE